MCEKDLKEATQIMYDLIKEKNLLGDELPIEKEKLSDETKHKIDLQVNQILKERYEKVKKTLIEKQSVLENMRDELMVKEKMNKLQILMSYNKFSN